MVPQNTCSWKRSKLWVVKVTLILALCQKDKRENTAEIARGCSKNFIETSNLWKRTKCLSDCNSSQCLKNTFMWLLCSKSCVSKTKHKCLYSLPVLVILFYHGNTECVLLYMTNPGFLSCLSGKCLQERNVKLFLICLITSESKNLKKSLSWFASETAGTTGISRASICEEGKCLCNKLYR